MSRLPHNPKRDGVPRPSLEAVFERCIEFGILKYENELGFTSNVSEQSLANMCLLDVDGSSTSCWPTSPDITSVFRGAMKDVEGARHQFERLSKWLPDVFRRFPDMQQQTSKMMKEELLQGGVTQADLEGKDWGEILKLLVDFRLHKDIVRISRPRDYEQNLKKYEFQVHLLTFRSNDPGIVDNANLYFNYDTSFEVFLRVLQDATQLSLIRVVNVLAKSKKRQNSISISQLLLPWCDDSEDWHPTPKIDLPADFAKARKIDQFYQQSLKADLEQQYAPADEPLSPSSSAFNEQSTNSENGPRLPAQLINMKDQKRPRNNDKPCGAPAPMMPNISSSSEAGYTLFHGPWSYCIALDESMKGPWSTICDELGYIKMLDTLKLRKDKISSPSRVFLQHSQDKRAYDDHVADQQDARKRAIKDEERWAATSEEWGQFEDELAASEPYGEYLLNRAETTYNEGDGEAYFRTDIFSV